MKTAVLTLQEIAPYLPYNLQILVYGDEIVNLKGLEVSQKGELYFSCQSPKYLGSYSNYIAGFISNPTPILRPLSDLTKEIEVGGEKFVPLEELSDLIDQNDMGYNDHYISYQPTMYDIDWIKQPYFIVEKLISWHFDVFGLIEQGLAIDINTLNL